MGSGMQEVGDERAILQLMAAWRTAPNNEIASSPAVGIRPCCCGTPKLVRRSAGPEEGTKMEYQAWPSVGWEPNSVRMAADRFGKWRQDPAPVGCKDRPAYRPAPWGGHAVGVYSVAFSTDGSYIISGSDDNKSRLWDPRTGQTICEALRGHENRVRSVAFSPDNKLIASRSEDKTLRRGPAPMHAR